MRRESVVRTARRRSLSLCPGHGRGWLAALALLGAVAAGTARAEEEGLAVVLETRADGAMSAEERGHLESAVVDALRSAQLQVVPAADREAILDGEPELRGCRTDECQDRIGRLLSAQTVVQWALKRGPGAAVGASAGGAGAGPAGAGAATQAAVPEPPPAGVAVAPAPARGKPKGGPVPPLRGAQEPPSPALMEPGSWVFTVTVFDVAIGAVGDTETAECSRCNVLQAKQFLGDLVKKAVLLDAARAQGTIEVTANPNADVAVDGRKLGFTPYRRPAFAGKHEITVSRTGYKSHHETVTVEEAKKAVLAVTLKPGNDVEPPIPTRGPRPKWRIAAGAAAIGVGALLIGFGASALSVNGQCISDPVPPALVCDDIYHTTGVGAGLLVPGILLVAGGAVTIALPGEMRLMPATPPANGKGALGLAGTF